jgi:S-DNA-T family DNA segregation ATPase FtsK/SpoIIIE
MTKVTPPTPTPPAEAEAPASPNWAQNFLSHVRRFARDFSGTLLIMLALMTMLALALPELTQGIFLTLWRDFLRGWFGLGSFFVAIGIAAAGLVILRRPPAETPDLSQHPTARLRPWKRLFALELALFAGMALLTALQGGSLRAAESGMGGGRIGWGLAELLHGFFSPLGLQGSLWTILPSGLILLACLVYGLGFSASLKKSLARWMELTPAQTLPEAEPIISIAPAEAAAAAASSGGRRKAALPPEFRKKFRMAPTDEKSGPPPSRDERLPSLDILINEQASRPDERHINEMAGLIEKTLAEFGIPAKVIGFRIGPTVTQFAVEPGFTLKPAANEEEATRQKVRVAQIASLRRDLSLALSAERLRIEAPVPGRPYVGIEVPNPRTSTVRLRPILESEVFYKVGSPLTIALGRDVSGAPVVADLTRMPHLLIAGTTGSGKSVCIAALTACLVMNNTPSDLRLVMIDPKMVELVRFNGLPHLYGKVETNLERILGVLRWTVVEMERRYKLLEEMHARDIEVYNRKISRRKGYEPLPRLVVMIDELADLMMSAAEETERTVVRLAQMARATGIHLVVATQRPSTDVITGLIKANFPARISFAVAASVDSRVILDTGGAETLLGHGDMLFLPPEAAAPIRCQGVLISDQEVERVITSWQQVHPQPEGELPPWEALLEEEKFTADKDDLITKAIVVVRETRRASASLLQRRLHIGYPRAARLMDELEEMGVVGPSQGGGKERDVLIDFEDEENQSND